MESTLELVRKHLWSARSVAVLTGAGISAESGLPTFRGESGLWKQYRPQQLATPEAFARDPHTVWEWYLWRRRTVRKAQPNAGHVALAEMQRRMEAGGGNKLRFCLVTQNVDGLHERAGSKGVLELHGNILRSRCPLCGNEWMDEHPVEEETSDAASKAQDIPRCVCGGMARPAVVWFGESLPARTLAAAQQAAQRSDFFLVVGTSASVYPAAALAPMARAAGAVVAEVNVEKSAISSSVDYFLQGRSAELLPQLAG